MIFIDKQKIIGTVWDVAPAENGKYIDFKLNTGEHNQDGSWTNSKWRPRAIGHAANSLRNVKAGDRIVITKAKISNPCYEQEDGSFKTFLKFLILEGHPADGSPVENTPPKQEPERAPRPQTEEDDEDTPW